MHDPLDLGMCGIRYMMQMRVGQAEDPGAVHGTSYTLKAALILVRSHYCMMPSIGLL